MSERAAVTSWFESNIALLPDELNVVPYKKLRVAVLGTCIAEGVADAFRRNGDHAEHHLLRPMRDSTAVGLDWGQFDAVVVHVTLRRLLKEAIGVDSDLLHVRPLSDTENQSLIDAFKRHLKAFVESVLSQVAASSPVFVLSMIEPPSSYQGILLNGRRQSLYFWVRTLNDELAAMLEDSASAHYVEVNDLVRYRGDSRITDAYTCWFTHAAIRNWDEGPQLFGMVSKRIHHAIAILSSQSPVKLIITDLDNTLWQGVLAEENYEDIVGFNYREGWPLAYTEALLEFKRRGGLLAISSKNDYEVIKERFALVWQEQLRLDDFCAIQIDWEVKSRHIQNILSETNVLPSNVLFVDDNPREIEEVSRAFPEIRTLGPPQELWRNIILYSPHTQVASISAESSNRTESLRVKQAREECAAHSNKKEFLASLELKVRCEIVDRSSHEKFSRVVELINKTNQFNTTGKRWDVSEFERLFGAGGYLAVASSSDKFESSGVVAVVVVSDGAILQFVLSCRVFGLGIESAVLSLVVERLIAERSEARAHYVATARNHACATFYVDHGFTKTPQEGVLRIDEHLHWPNWIGRDLEMPPIGVITEVPRQSD